MISHSLYPTVYVHCFSLVTTLPLTFFFFFFNDTATTEIYTLSLHDALPISDHADHVARPNRACVRHREGRRRTPRAETRDRKSTRLNSSHSQISYAVFCLKKKKKNTYKIVSCYTRTHETRAMIIMVCA